MNIETEFVNNMSISQVKGLNEGFPETLPLGEFVKKGKEFCERYGCTTAEFFEAIRVMRKLCRNL